MSYILEALNKSQRERERALAATGSSKVSTKRTAGRQYKGYLSLGLAVAAMLISLYAALGGRFSGGSSSGAPVSVSAPNEPSRVVPAESGIPAGDLSGSGAVTAVPSGEEGTPMVKDAPSETLAAPRSSIAPEDGSAATNSETEATGSPAKREVSPIEIAETPKPEPQPAAADVPAPESPPLTKEQSTAVRVPEPQPPTTSHQPVAPPADSGKLVAKSPLAPVKEEKTVDFRDEAERLKRRLLSLAANSRGSKPLPIEPDPVPAPSAGSSPARKLPPSPAKLPPAVFEALPERRLVAHVYAASPRQRFVILNSMKMREGDTAPNGITLEEILPDGMILVFQGHKFYSSR